MKPYYQDKFATLYHADCREVLPTLDAGSIDLVLTDPPYGIGADRSQWLRADTQHGAAAAPSKNYGTTDWDHKVETDLIAAIVGAANHAIVWGGQYYSLPSQSCWLVWDKDNGANGYADCELAWTNLPGATRRKRYRWMGMLQEYGGDDKEQRFHPTQKPVAVMQWCINLSKSEETILDPFAGSGTTLVAAKLEGRKTIGIEIEERYCEIAARRLAQGVLEFDAVAV